MLSRGGDHGNEFPNGSCKGQAVKERSRGRSYCGWVSSVHKRVYIMPGAFLPRVNFTDVRLRNAILTGAYLKGVVLRGADWRDANLYRADLSSANLLYADLRGADLTGVIANSRTRCPNGINWGTSGNDCPF